MPNEGHKDEMKGRLKEATGAVTGNDDMKHEGRSDQRKGKMEQAGEKLKDAAKDAREGLSK